MHVNRATHNRYRARVQKRNGHKQRETQSYIHMWYAMHTHVAEIAISKTSPDMFCRLTRYSGDKMRHGRQAVGQENETMLNSWD